MSPFVDKQAPLIAHVLFRFDVGGLENGVVNLINRLPRERWRHVIVALDTVSVDFCRRVQRNDVEYIAIGKPPGHLLPLYPRLVALFRGLRPAIVHTRNLAALEASVPACLARVPVRIHGEHGWDMSDVGGTNPRHRLARRMYRPFVHRYVALSEHLRSYLENRIGVPARRIAQIYNGVDLQRFRNDITGSPPADFPFAGPDVFSIAAVGRMQAVKDPVNLARAFVEACRSGHPAAGKLRLVMVGDGPQLADVRAVLQNAALLDRAWLPGERSDVASILRHVHCYVSPSKAEGISNTILEAMATGLPVIATRVGGNPELVTDGHTGRLVPSENAAALAQAMLNYLGDPEAARRDGEAGLETVQRRFSLDRMVADYDSLYASLLASRTGRPIAVPGPVKDTTSLAP
ncbi:MAG: TIGR03088 family PEP-CTERM/XrtA system glycosyltransferase [Burkholderiales bacterium]|nr:TIGR03088 family PEP-CTERM/XrtA system glycosyltransferase [Burkholderiales bacterium]